MKVTNKNQAKNKEKKKIMNACEFIHHSSTKFHLKLICSSMCPILRNKFLESLQLYNKHLLKMEKYNDTKKKKETGTFYAREQQINGFVIVCIFINQINKIRIKMK